MESSTKGKLSLIALCLMIFTSVYGFNNIPRAFFRMGYAAIPWYIIAGLLFFIPFAFMVTELGSAFKKENGGIYSWMQKSVGPKFAFIGTFMWYSSYVIWMLNISTGILAPLTNAIFGETRLPNVVWMSVFGIIWIIMTTLISLKGIDDNKNEITSNAVHPYQLIDKINEQIDDAYFVTDVGQHQMWAAQRVKLNQGNRFISSGGLGTMGYGLPAAIGVSTAIKDATTIALVGDGGIQMTMEEFILLKQYNLNVKVFILNNQRLGMVRQWQELFHESRFSSTILDHNPDFELIAKAYNIFYMKVKTKEELAKIDNVFIHNEPMIIEVMIDTETNVLPMIPANGSFEEIIT